MQSQDLFEKNAAPRAGKTGTTALAHCDGGARGNPGPAGYGAVITDEAGTTLAELSEFLGRRTNNYAEYSGLLGVLQWALEHGVAHLRVVSDSELMVKQVQGRYKVNSPDLRPLFEEARRRIQQLGSFQISHALRHKNKDADRLANEAMDRGTGRGGAAGSVGAASTSGVRTGAGTALPVSSTASKAPAMPGVPAGAGRSAGSGVSASAGGTAAAGASASATAAGSDMLRGFVRDGVVHLLGGKTLPDGSFVKVIAE